MKLLTLFFLCIISATLGQVIRTGPCRQLPVVKNFNAALYLGVWYQLQRYEYIQENGTDCNTADYSLSDDGTYVNVINSATILSTGNHVFANGSAVVSYPNEKPVLGFLNVTFGGAPNEKNYQVVSTDYNGYSVVWNCRNTNDGNSAEYAWVLSRSYTVDEEDGRTINKIIADYLDSSEMRPTYQNQTACLGGGIEPIFNYPNSL